MPDFLTIYISFWVFIFGIVIGSFLNVVILRRLSEESIIFPPSKCPKCGHALKWWHNIPLLSYILLKGKCYFCHEKISIQYFLVELTTGILFVLSFLKFHFSILTLLAWILLSLFVVMSVTDIKEKIIFDRHSIPLIVVGLLFSFFNHNIVEGLIGMLLGVAIMELCAVSGYLFVKSRAFGFGDTLILAGLGAMLGWKYVIAVLFIAMVTFSLMVLPLFLKKLYDCKDFQTLWAVVIFIATLGLDKIATTLKSDNIILLNSLAIFVLITAIYTVIRILKGLKNAKDKGLVLPFGPALFIAATILLLYYI